MHRLPVITTNGPAGAIATWPFDTVEEDKRAKAEIAKKVA